MSDTFFCVRAKDNVEYLTSWTLACVLLLAISLNIQRLLPQSYLPALACLVLFVMLSEHLQHPRPINWRIDLRLGLLPYSIVRVKKYLTHIQWRTVTNVEKSNS